MQKINTSHPDIILIKPEMFKDNRGSFFESYNLAKMKELGIDATFIQDNQSVSDKNILRGLHFQSPPFAQAKLVRVVKGSVLDVAVDIRKQSLYFGKWVSQVLSEYDQMMMFIPVGFAHGFLSLESNTIFQYKCTAYYNKESEGVLKWDDKSIGIDWKILNPIISIRDNQGLSFNEFDSPFE